MELNIKIFLKSNEIKQNLLNLHKGSLLDHRPESGKDNRLIFKILPFRIFF